MSAVQQKKGRYEGQKTAMVTPNAIAIPSATPAGTSGNIRVNEVKRDVQ